MDQQLTTDGMKKLILAKLSHHFGLNQEEASNEHYYKALAMVIKDIMLYERGQFMQRAIGQSKRQVYYICMEFLMGRSLKNNLYNLGLDDVAHAALLALGIKIENVYEQEPDAGLGNGGLGRLAACFLDGLASGGFAATGYSLKYEYGIFRQKLVDGWQTELPDFWLPGGEVWLQPHPERTVKVMFNGSIQESWDGQHHSVNLVNPTVVNAVPYDILISGYGGHGISKLRLWSAESHEFDMKLFNSGDYFRAMEQDAMAQVITKVLYPEDNHTEGKSLRLSQQYFLVSATVQDIVQRHLRNFNTLDSLHEHAVIHLNDTHPVLAIPELMRIMLDKCGYGWDEAWDIVSKTFAYTNHTVMSEALECWSQDLLQIRLPRIYQIIEEINRRFCAHMHSLSVDGSQVGRMAILNDGLVKMANLAVSCAYCINGVSKLHSQILKDKVFHDFYTVMPEKFTNVTNGIVHRRWLNQSNPKLAAFIGELIGDGFVTDAKELQKLVQFKDNSQVLEILSKIKHDNKLRMIKFIETNSNVSIDPYSIFDVQVKRLHEYKRQHLNALNILATYQWLRENPHANFTPKTYIFSAKAAPGYYFAKQIIRFIVELGHVINNDPIVKDKLKIIYLEDYRVTIAELLMPASEISEQISLAGTEASGTGNMKFMINGAITLGTLDGANVEMLDAVGPENIIIFGLNANEVVDLKKSGYNPSVYYNNNAILRRAIDELSVGFNNVKFNDITRSLVTLDPYMVLADFADYRNAQDYVSNLYLDKTAWNRISLMNIANSGYFSGDRSIADYTQNIWHATPVE